MWIIEDTRQQKDKHTTKQAWFIDNHIQTIRCKLPFGDYALPPKVAIDTKKGLEEIAGNICGDREEHHPAAGSDLRKRGGTVEILHPISGHQTSRAR